MPISLWKLKTSHNVNQEDETNQWLRWIWARTWDFLTDFIYILCFGSFHFLVKLFISWLCKLFKFHCTKTYSLLWNKNVQKCVLNRLINLQKWIHKTTIERSTAQILGCFIYSSVSLKRLSWSDPFHYFLSST